MNKRIKKRNYDLFLFCFLIKEGKWKTVEFLLKNGASVDKYTSGSSLFIFVFILGCVCRETVSVTIV